MAIDPAAFSSSMLPLREYAHRASRLLCLHSTVYWTRTLVIAASASTGERVSAVQDARVGESHRREFFVWPDFPLALVSYGQEGVPQVLYWSEHRARAHTANNVDTKGTAQNKPVIQMYGTGRGYGRVHRVEPPAPAKGVYRALRQAFTRHRAAFREARVLNLRKHLSAIKCHRGDGQSASEYREDE